MFCCLLHMLNMAIASHTRLLLAWNVSRADKEQRAKSSMFANIKSQMGLVAITRGMPRALVLNLDSYFMSFGNIFEDVYFQDLEK